MGGVFGVDIMSKENGAPDLPDGVPEDGIAMDPTTQLCDEHLQGLAGWEIPIVSGMQTALEVLLKMREFYKVAYEDKNDYTFSEGMDQSDVPQSDRPGPENINYALNECSPVCCFIEDHLDDPFPNDPTSPFIGVLAAAVQGGDVHGSEGS